MNITLITNNAFHPWGPETPDTTGIGGSETSQVELAWRLARRGHNVRSYAPLTPDSPLEWKGSFWGKTEEADYSRGGIWLVYRSPELLDKFPPAHPGQSVWFVAQDTDYDFTVSQVDRMDYYMTLCRTHSEYVRQKYGAEHPNLNSKIRQSSNGIRVDLIRQIEKENIERNPRKLVYASSPDRGLMQLLHIFKRAKEWVPDLELHVCYGFDNIDILIEKMPEYRCSIGNFRDSLKRQMQQPGVTWHGRLSQSELARQWFSAGIWCHPSSFTETSCITSMDAQACGAVPITNPIWAVGENVSHGIFLQGDPVHDGLVQARYAAELVALAKNPDLQEKIRRPMMEAARMRFNWERVVDELEAMFYGYDNIDRAVYSQFNFQLKYAGGRILNIGCDEDAPKLKAMGAVNLDVLDYHPTLKRRNPIDVQHDARFPLPFAPGSFDTCIVGEVIEHMVHADAVKTIRNARDVLAPGGRLVITYPEDRRTRKDAHVPDDIWLEEYVEGVKGYHHHIPKEEFLTILEEAGVQPDLIQDIDYGFTNGYGCIASPVEAIVGVPC